MFLIIGASTAFGCAGSCLTYRLQKDHIGTYIPLFLEDMAQVHIWETKQKCFNQTYLNINMQNFLDSLLLNEPNTAFIFWLIKGPTLT